MYIRSVGNISAQLSFSQLLKEPAVYTTNRLTCIEPDYSTIVDPKLIRRMSRIIKMGVAAGMECLKEAGINNPDAIITGTAYGCLADTESFLSKMVENKEELLTPTAFIQSTHNTVGAQIALMLKCHNYNNTFVHRGFSFESAMLDAITLINDGDAASVLVGGVDEITNTSHQLLSRFGLYKTNPVSSASIFESEGKGTVDGEGAAFFLLDKKASGNDYAALKALHTFYKPAGKSVVEKNISDFLAMQSVDANDIDLIITGKNGDRKNDEVYEQLSASLFKNKVSVNYKHLCGEYPTSSAFALWLAANCIKTGIIPGLPTAKKPSTILIYNNYLSIHHSLYLLSAC
ncbi:MAG: beta-ketoacyl synthase chain length factor [Chitinophagaceae bacterium]|nr:beta-ketoacyl synthase chain length factor [Chitinophagaceae bacterium]